MENRDNKRKRTSKEYLTPNPKKGKNIVRPKQNKDKPDKYLNDQPETSNSQLMEVDVNPQTHDETINDSLKSEQLANLLKVEKNLRIVEGVEFDNPQPSTSRQGISNNYIVAAQENPDDVRLIQLLNIFAERPHPFPHLSAASEDLPPAIRLKLMYIDFLYDMTIKSDMLKLEETPENTYQDTHLFNAMFFVVNNGNYTIRKLVDCFVEKEMEIDISSVAPIVCNMLYHINLGLKIINDRHPNVDKNSTLGRCRSFIKAMLVACWYSIDQDLCIRLYRFATKIKSFLVVLGVTSFNCSACGKEIYFQDCECTFIKLATRESSLEQCEIDIAGPSRNNASPEDEENEISLAIDNFLMNFSFQYWNIDFFFGLNFAEHVMLRGWTD